jgi:hypothetical protein
MGTEIYRNDGLVQLEMYETELSNADAVVELVRRKWSLLRERDYAADYPIEILRGNSSPTRVIEVFRWRSQQDRINAQNDPDCLAIDNTLASFSLSTEKGLYTGAVRGFNTNFPSVGGVELLKGVCSCLLTIDGVVKDYPMSVKNGIVLMHRSPRADPDKDGRNEMYLKILMHGGEIVQAALGPIRVEQNFLRPNDGIVKSHGKGDRDFPATAIWRVAWKIQTPIGTVLTDPDTPLVFGPATVTHYPPVGTRFQSSTGPVKLILQETGQRIGTLVPGELTAFDIVTTKDDEIYADHLNIPPKEIFETLAEHVKRHDEEKPKHIEVREVP